MNDKKPTKSKLKKRGGLTKEEQKAYDKTTELGNETVEEREKREKAEELEKEREKREAKKAKKAE